MLNARTPLQYISAIHDAKPTDEADTAPVVVPDAELPALPQPITSFRHAPRREPNSSPRHEGAGPPSTLGRGGLV